MSHYACTKLHPIHHSLSRVVIPAMLDSSVAGTTTLDRECRYMYKAKQYHSYHSETCAIRHPVTSDKNLWSQSISVN